MQPIPLLAGLSAIADHYDGIICDVWGVLHNGADGYPAAGEALARFRAAGKAVVLITNVPRPVFDIGDVFERFSIPADACDAVMTSGELTHRLLARAPGRRCFHLGQERNLSVFDGLDVEVVDEEQADVVVCTGLVDEETETADDYRPMLARLAGRGLSMICANPDIVVERGPRLVYCAGALALLYEELGGKVMWIGKPHKPIYDAVLEELARIAGRPIARERVLAIGDGLPTDIRGAHGQGIDALMVTGGIHAGDFGDPAHPDMALLHSRLAGEGLSIRAAIPYLIW